MQANLLDILGDVASPQLTYDIKSRRNSTSEMRLRAEIGKLINSYTVDLAGFKRTFTEWLENTSIGNSFNFWVYYKLIDVANGVQVWHCNAQGDPDRLVCLVLKKEAGHE